MCIYLLTCFRNGFATVFEQSIVVKTMEETTKVLVGVGCMFFVFWCCWCCCKEVLWCFGDWCLMLWCCCKEVHKYNKCCKEVQ